MTGCTHTRSQKKALTEHCCVSDMERVAVCFGGKCHHVMYIVSLHVFLPILLS